MSEVDSKPVNVGCLWRDKTWEDAIVESIEKGNKDIKQGYKRGTGIKKCFVYTNPNSLLNTETKFSHFIMWGDGGRKRYKTKIPKRYNGFIDIHIIKQEDN